MGEARRLGDRYEVGALIGRGGMAEVHEGRDLRLGRRVAIKILKPDLAIDPTFLARFRREAQSAAALNHPNIVAVYDTGEDVLGEGLASVTVPFIVMELVDGQTLKELLQAGNPLVPERALELTADVLAALDYSHRHGIIHRDIKPGNVMLTSTGVVKVMDFGIARATSDGTQTGTSASVVMGTAAYLSPEQAQGKKVDARSDLYSTGVLLFELLTRRQPFIAEAPVAVAFAHVNEAPPTPSSINPALTASLDTLVARAMAKDADDRYQTAVEFRADVQRAIAGFPVTQVMSAGATAVLGADAEATAMMEASSADAATALVGGAAATGAMAPVVPGGAGSTPGAGGPTPEPDKKSGPGRTIGLVALGVVLVGGVIWAFSSLFGSSSNSVLVPDVTDLTVVAAESRLSDVDLKVGRQNFAPSDAAEGTVIGQSPSPGEQVSEGSSVDLEVSAGKEQVQVPDLVDFRSLDDVRSSLAAVGLNLGKVAERDSDEPAETVLSQSPEAYSMADKGSSVDIVVSSGQVDVPDVVGMTQARASDELRAAGFEIGVVEASSTESPGTVISQSPKSGAKADKGSQVTITVAVAPTPSATPTASETPSASPTSTDAADAPAADAPQADSGAGASATP